MVVKSFIERPAGVVRKMKVKHGSSPSLCLLGFCLSLVPVPSIQYAGKVLDKKLGNKKFKREVQQLWVAIIEENPKIAEIISVEKAVEEILETVLQSDNLLEKCEEFSNFLATTDSSLIVNVEYSNYRELVNAKVIEMHS